MKNCDCHTEINTDGSGQLQRYLKALDPSYAPIDNRSIEDLLVFAKRYAAQIRFYDLPETAASYDENEKEKISWRDFFRRDMAVVIASVAITDLYSFKKEFNEVRDKLETDADPDLFAALFNPAIGILKKIDRWYTVAIPENPLYNDLVIAIESDLRRQARNILAYKKQFHDVDPNNPLKIDIDDIVNKELWGLDQPVPEDSSLYQGDTVEEQIRYAALNVEDIFYSFYNFLSKLISDSGKYLEFAIDQYPGHQPHMALFITFLELFRIVQKQMNGLTEKMLDFYYREVLRLVEKTSIPDKAHIIFELAKEVAGYHLEQGTALSAGNDLSGKEQVYKTGNDFVINQAKVTELKTIFVEKYFLYGKEIKEENDQVIHSIYARPVAKSQDGFGEKFTDPNPKWYTFGAGSPVIKEPKNICEAIDLVKKISARKDDQAQIGFAIASHQLFMEGGKRLVELTFRDEVTFPILERLEAGRGDLFEIWFTGEKEWFKINNMMTGEEQVDFTGSLKIGIFNPSAKADNNYDGRGSYYLDSDKNALCIYLPMSESPVVAYDSKLHSDFNYSTVLPVMQVRLNPVIDLDASDYRLLSAAGLSLRVKVGSINPVTFTEPQRSIATIPHFDGLSKLVLNTENGLQAVGKPFDPYGPYPARGKFFYIGSNEVFNKSFDVFDGEESSKNGQIALTIKKTQDNESTPGNTPLSSHGGSDEYKVEILKRRDWIKLSHLNSDGNFDQFALTQNILTKATDFNSDHNVTGVAGVALPRLPILQINEWKPGTEKGFLKITNLIPTTGTMEARQNQASTMEIAEVYISYDSTLQNLEDSVDEFYHVYPFGNVQIYTSETKNAIDKIAGLNKADSAKNILLTIASNKEDDPLIVDAKQLLLPHFTYESPYEKYNTDAKELKPETNGSITIKRMRGITTTGVGKNLRRDKATIDLMLNASGLSDKLEGDANQYSSLAQEEGLLQIGIENLEPLQTVSLLFQFAEGSAEDEDKQPPDIHWSYLTNNEWRPLKAENIVADGTFGFQTTGIIKISLPEDATNHNSICTDGLHWLCASVTKDSNRIPQLIDVVTQATEVIFEDNQNDQSHFDKALPAGTISKLVLTVPEVTKVSQPFASFDGKHHEIGKEFYTRVSERLRHKQRAITPWDYEHLVLDRFPSIYKVKCITYTDPDCLCREPLPKDPVAADTSEKIPVKLEPKKVALINDAAERARLLETIKKFKDNPAWTMKLVGHRDSSLASMGLNNKRMAQLMKLLLNISGINKDRITSTIIADGEKDLIEIEIIKPGIDTKATKEEKICCGPQIAPGHVLLVPIANLKNRNAVNPLQPKTARRTLLDIESYLKKLTSPFVNVHAKNPVYEQVLVFFRVKFYPQYEIGFYLKKLNEEIVHFLTPWAFDENAEVKFGQKIYASSIINFIEERKYVDFITDFNMVICKDECCPQPKETKQKITDEDIVAIVRLTATEGGTFTGIDGIITKKTDSSPIPGVTVKAGATTISTMTDTGGKFKLEAGIQHNGTLSFSLTGFVPASVDIKFDQDQEFVFKKDDHAVLNEWGLSIDKIEKLCGCSNVEYLLQDEMDLPGDIVARPSTARSILVSAPQHIIVPYKEPPYLTPCEKKALSSKKFQTGTKALTHPGILERAPTETITTSRKKGSDTKETKRTQRGKKNTGKKPNK